MLIKYEFIKYFTRFHTILIAVLLVLNVGMTAFQFRDLFFEEQREINAAKDALILLYQTDPAEYERIYSEHQSRLAEFEAQYYQSIFENAEKSKVFFENQYIDYPNYGDRQLFDEVEQIKNKPAAYRQAIISLLRDAISRLDEMEDAGDTYLYQYYSALCDYYLPLADMEPEIVRVSGYNEFFSLKTPIVFLTIALVSTLCGVFTHDSRAGMGVILHVSKHGGRAVIRAKLIFVMLISAGLSLIFTLSPMLVFLPADGFSPMNQPLQMLDLFQYCPYSLTVGEYILIFAALRALFFTVITLAAAVCSQIFRDEKAGILAAAGLAASGVILAGIPANSEYGSLRLYSAYELADVHILFERFRGLNLFGKCCNYTCIMIAAFVLLGVITVLLSWFQKPTEEIKQKTDGAKSVFSRGRESLFETEFYKHFVSDGYLYIVLAAILLKCLISGIYYQPSFGDTDTVYMDYIAMVRGEITEEKLQRIAEEEEYIASTLERYDTVVKAYRNNELSYDEYRTFLGQYHYAEHCKNACDKLCDRRDYLLTAAETYPDVEFIYEEGLARYFSTPLDFVFLILALILGGNVFSCEYASGFSKIMRTASRGRKQIFRVKCLYAVSAAVILSLLFGVIDFVCLRYYYSIDFWDAHVMSMPMFAESQFDMSVLTYFLLYQLISLCGRIFCMLFVSALSALLENQIKAIITAALMIILPVVLLYLQILPVPIFSFVYFISPQNIGDSMTACVGCVLLTAVLMIAAHRKWNDRRVKK